MKLSEPSLWTRPETTHTPEAAIMDPIRINTLPSISICPTVGAKCHRGETTYAELDAGGFRRGEQAEKHDRKGH
jgi:hypothetical protein